MRGGGSPCSKPGAQCAGQDSHQGTEHPCPVPCSGPLKSRSQPATGSPALSRAAVTLPRFPEHLVSPPPCDNRHAGRLTLGRASQRDRVAGDRDLSLQMWPLSKMTDAGQPPGDPRVLPGGLWALASVGVTDLAVLAVGLAAASSVQVPLRRRPCVGGRDSSKVTRGRRAGGRRAPERPPRVPARGELRGRVRRA